MTVTVLFPPSLGTSMAAARAAAAREALRVLPDTVVVEVATDYAELEAAVVSGSVALAWAPPAICAAVLPSVAAAYKAVRSGRSSYRGAIVARRSVTSIEELRGTRAAWIDRRSAAGYLLPRALLRAHGIDPEHDLQSESVAGSYAQAVEDVLVRKADFTAVYVHRPHEDDAREQLRRVHPLAAKQLHTIGFTEPTASDGLLVSHGRHRAALEDLLERWCDDGLGERDVAAVRCFDADRFERASAGDYRALRRR